MNRTYLQKYLKTNSSIQWLYMKYMQYYAKNFLNHPETWKQWQLAKLTAMLSYAQRHCTYYRKYIVGEVRMDNSMEIIKSLPLLDKPEFWISNFPSIEDNSRKTLLWRTSRSPLPYVYV